VENIFAPPELQREGDYLVALHVLQIVEASRGKLKLGTLCDKARILGYRGTRVEDIVDWLSTAKVSPEYKQDNVSVIPLLRCQAATRARTRPRHHSSPREDIQVFLTDWGRYHLTTLIYQLKYWKHALYGIPFPRRVLEALRGTNEEIHETQLLHNLQVVFGFLYDVESHWFKAGGFEDIHPVMESVQSTVSQQCEGRKHIALRGRSTSLHFAASQQNVGLVDLVLRDSPHLAHVRDEKDMLPIDIARATKNALIIERLSHAMGRPHTTRLPDQKAASAKMMKPNQASEATSGSAPGAPPESPQG
jgi:hypothetical protein